MITVLFYATVKEDNVQTFHDQVVRLTAITRAEDDGCLTMCFISDKIIPASSCSMNNGAMKPPSMPM